MLLSVAMQAHRAGCSITRYSSSHSFNPLVNSRSEYNLSQVKNVFQAQNFPFQPLICSGVHTYLRRCFESNVQSLELPLICSGAHTCLRPCVRRIFKLRKFSFPVVKHTDSGNLHFDPCFSQQAFKPFSTIFSINMNSIIAYIWLINSIFLVVFLLVPF